MQLDTAVASHGHERAWDPAGGDVEFNVAISPDSSRVVFLADQEANDVIELYTSRWRVAR